jgi:neutral ceramidase
MKPGTPQLSARVLCLLIGLVFPQLRICLAAEVAGPLSVGAATSNITPPLGASMNGGMADRKATHVHDELHARCVVFDNSHTRIAIVVCDSCAIHRETFDRAKQLAQQATGIPADHMLTAATHTHSAPTSVAVFQSEPDPAYQQFLATRVADGIRRAANNLAPARIGWGTGRKPEHVFNRRWSMKPGAIPPDPFGRATDRVQMNPPQGSPNLIKPAGPTDPQLPVISLQSMDGRPVGVLANYALHYVGGSASWSRTNSCGPKYRRSRNNAPSADEGKEDCRSWRLGILNRLSCRYPRDFVATALPIRAS